jgi:hypothetical protein
VNSIDDFFVGGIRFLQLLEELRKMTSPKKQHIHLKQIQTDEAKVNQIFTLIQSILGTFQDSETQQRIDELIKTLTNELQLSTKKEIETNNNTRTNVEIERNELQELRKQLAAERSELERQKTALEEVLNQWMKSNTLSLIARQF